ncbi:MAG: hypothetical protein JSU96_20350 [Acidobacteriota bacterium]|nr:MAG: hypothetical protein JSU96_20350 [Acidobacteriota bacterium]
MFELDYPRLLALFFFTGASFGFIYFMTRYPRHSPVRRIGIRICHALGFAGALVLYISNSSDERVVVMIALSLLFSLIGFEISTRFLRRF